MSTSKLVSNWMDQSIQYFSLSLILFLSILHAPIFAGEDDNESVYGYHGIPGCGCFTHCTCFSHYIGPFRPGFEGMQNGAFPLDTPNHPNRPEDVVWHEFMKGILRAKKSVWFLECDATKLRYYMKFYSSNDLCMLDEYIDCIELFKQLYETCREERISLINKWYPSNNESKIRTEKINDIHEHINSALRILESIPSQIAPIYKDILKNCSHVNETHNMAFFYNSALINFLEGKWEDFAWEAERLIQLTEINKKFHILNSGFYHKYGVSQVQVGNYHNAIEALSKAIAKNPENKEAYFQRAIAYFEIGDFDQSIVDYLFSEKNKNISKLSKISFEFQISLLAGLIEGGEESAIDFFPSIWDSACGIGQTLWVLAQHPINTTTNFYNSCYELAQVTVEYFHEFDWDTLDEYVYEVKLLCEKFDSLTDSEKGRLIGYCVGKYGCDILQEEQRLKVFPFLKK